MARQISASNAVVSSIEQASAVFGVRSYRMNSRTIIVPGAGGRERPMFMGQWIDRYGVKHNKGMADMLLTPRIFIAGRIDAKGHVVGAPSSFCVALWVECKSGSGSLTPEQKTFRDDVVDAGAYYILAHNGPDPVIAWFEEMGVRR